MKRLGLSLLAVFLLALTALAQKPEAQVLCVPGFQGRWQVTVSVQKDEPKAALDARMKVIATAVGGRRAGAQNTQKIAAGPVTLSTLSFVTTAPLAKPDGSLVLEPFVLALREFSRVQITYNVPDVFTYKGSPSVRAIAASTVALSAKQPGALTLYGRVQLKDHQVRHAESSPQKKWPGRKVTVRCGECVAHHAVFFWGRASAWRNLTGTGSRQLIAYGFLTQTLFTAR